ncbi:MAG: glycosyltransferase family 39 protein [Natronospirillum sp.]
MPELGHQSQPKNTNSYLTLALVFGVVLLIYRLVALYLTAPGLFFDEAYYYGWSQTPDWGYYSKPPVVAWIIFIATELFGKSEFTVKLAAPILHTCTALVIYFIGQRLHSAKAGFYAFLTFLTMPFIGLESWFITTDAPLLLCWSLLLFFYLRAIETNHWKDWILGGVFGGLGLLSKYTMALFPIAILFYFVATLHFHQFKNLRFWALVLITAIIFLPNMVWNYQYGFPSIMHTLDLAGVREKQGNPIEFFLGQFLVFGPIAFALLLSWLHPKKYKTMPLAVSLALIPIILLFLQSFRNEAYVNWAAMGYVAGSVLAGISFTTFKPRLFKLSIGINVLAMLIFYHFTALANFAGINLTSNTTPYARVDGWRELGEYSNQLAKAYPDHVFVSTRRNINSYLSFYLDDTLSVRTINPSEPPADHYGLKYVISDNEKRAILVLPSRISESVYAQFDEVEQLSELRINRYGQESTYYYYRAIRY